jgi:hypothetical protein
LSVLLEIGVPAHRADGGKISAFARSLQWAKTDRLDARTLALYGRERGATLRRWTPPAADQQELTALVRRRADLVAARKVERTRAKAPGAKAVAASLARMLAFLDGEIKQLEARIANLIAATPELARRNQVLVNLPGVGPTVAASLLALLPEMGSRAARPPRWPASRPTRTRPAPPATAAVPGMAGANCGRCCSSPPSPPCAATTASPNSTTICSPREKPNASHSSPSCVNSSSSPTHASQNSIRQNSRN